MRMARIVSPKFLAFTGSPAVRLASADRRPYSIAPVRQNRIPLRARAHRLAVQDVALSRRKHGFDSRWARPTISDTYWQFSYLRSSFCPTSWPISGRELRQVCANYEPSFSVSFQPAALVPHSWPSLCRHCLSDKIPRRVSRGLPTVPFDGVLQPPASAVLMLRPSAGGAALLIPAPSQLMRFSVACKQHDFAHS